MCGVAAIPGAVGLFSGEVGSQQNRAADAASSRWEEYAALANAQSLRYSAEQTRQAGLINEQKSREATDQTIGAQRAGYGASGFDVNVGTAAEVQVGTAEMGELDALLIRTEAENAATALEFDADMETQRASFESQRQESLKKGGTLSFVGDYIPVSSGVSGQLGGN